MTKLFKLPATLLLTTCLAGATLAQNAPVITDIELGQTGIARYTLSGEISGNVMSFQVPEDAASDVLASLIVRDPAGGVVDLQTDTPGSVGAALRGSAFGNGFPTDTATLLAALVGEPVELTTVIGTVKGQMMGLGQIEVVNDGERLVRDKALLLTETGVSEVILTPGTRVGFSSDAAGALADAMQASQSTRDMRQFDLTLSADTPRTVDMSYVTEAAAWKNSWRLVMDEGRLQGWATFENVSGTDWDDVSLTLTTGAPVAYRRNLVNPLFVARPELSPPEATPLTQDLRRTKNGVAGLTSMFSAGALETSASAPALQVAQTQTSGILRYALPEEIDLGDGRTTNMMYIDLPIAPAIRGLFQPAHHTEDVVMAAAITPDQPLAAGLISVQDGAGFLGDAQFDGMQAGQTRLLPFAAAVGSKVVTETDETYRINTAVFNEGTLTLKFERLNTTTYATTLPPQVDLFTVEHPRTLDTLGAHTGTAELDNGLYRITAPVVENKGNISVTEVDTHEEPVDLTSRSLGRILTEMKSGEVEMPEALRTAFFQASGLANKRDAAKSEADTLQGQYDGLVGEQKRLIENLKTVRQDALRQRYLEALDKTETQIAENFDRIDELSAEQEALQQQILQVFAGL